MMISVWIRNQVKNNLRIVNNLHINQKQHLMNGNSYYIICSESFDFDNVQELGCYSNYDKALKVLDMISLFISGKYVELERTGYNYRKYGSSIFQMPNDEEVFL